jgi:hypothetical protein
MPLSPTRGGRDPVDRRWRACRLRHIRSKPGLMNLVFRLLGVAFRALCSHRLSVFCTSRVSMHVWPSDLDLNLHVNDGRYLSYCDLGKVDLMLRAGQGKLALARKWQLIVGGCLIRFRFPLRAFERITVVTRVL